MNLQSKVSIGLVVALSGLVSWLFATFATIQYVDAKVEGHDKAIADIKAMLNVIDQRTWEMSGRRAPLPVSLSPEGK